jgi:hypothetical protein
MQQHSPLAVTVDGASLQVQWALKDWQVVLLKHGTACKQQHRPHMQTA